MIGDGGAVHPWRPRPDDERGPGRRRRRPGRPADPARSRRPGRPSPHRPRPASVI